MMGKENLLTNINYDFFLFGCATEINGNKGARTITNVNSYTCTFFAMTS